MSESTPKTETEPKTAAGPWTKGTPDKEADYLIKYTTHQQTEPRVSTGRWLPDHGWLNKFPGMNIIEYAEIYNE